MLDFSNPAIQALIVSLVLISAIGFLFSAKNNSLTIDFVRLSP